MVMCLRFQRFGRPKNPFFRLVAVDKREKRDGAVIEKLGSYNPKTKEVKLTAERIKYWLTQGAKCSPSVERLLKKSLVQENGGEKRE